MNEPGIKANSIVEFFGYSPGIHKRIFFSSDHHWGHANIIKYCNRPYTDAHEMNKDMIERWNAKVTKNDVVWYLGDFSMNPSNVAAILERLNYKELHLVPGNHDKCFRQDKKWVEQYRKWFTSVNFVDPKNRHECNFLNNTVGFNEVVNISHFPYKNEGDSGYVDRYNDIRTEDNGKVLLCGHIHEKWKHKFTEKGTLMVNVGVDAWDLAPVHMNDLLTYIQEVKNSVK